MVDYATTPEEAEKIRIRARARVKAQGAYDAPSTSPSDIAKRWRKGIVDLVSAPADLVNAGIRLTFKADEAIAGAIGAGGAPSHQDPPQIMSVTGEDREYLASKGFIPDPNEPADNFLEHTAEILGAGSLPHVAFTAKGTQILNQSIKQMDRMGILKTMAVGTAARPGAVATMEAAASTGAGAGRSIAEYNNASPEVQVMAEMLGGLSPIAFIGAARQLSTLRVLGNAIQKHLLPFTRPGAWQRASKRMRDIAANPERSAARIDPDSPIPPARQAGDERLLALEKAILNENPEMASDTSKLLDNVREVLRDEVINVFGGDKNRPRELLVRAKSYLIDLLDLRAAAAADRVQARLSRLDPNASPRDINQQVRSEIDVAYNTAREDETVLWNSIDSDAPVSLENAKERLSEALATRSRFDDPKDIPEWIKVALGESEISPALRKQLQLAGAVDSNGNFVPGMKKRLIEEGILPDSEYTFNDARAIRSRLLQEVRAEQGVQSGAPNRNKIRILSSIANGTETKGGLLDDIGSSGVAGAQEAREFSAELNRKFTRGQVGRLLGYDKTGAERISGRATLDYLIAGKDPQTNIAQLVEAAPQTRPLIEDYLKAEFIAKTDGGANRRAANTFIKQWERRGAFEEFPELRDNLRRYSSDLEAAERLGVRADKVRTFANHSGKSTAALYLDSDPGDEMRMILTSKRPETNARKLMAKVRGDARAEAGLRTTFLEEGFNQSQTNRFYQDGTPIYSGDKFTSYLSQNKGVAKALNVTEVQWGRLENVALRMRQLDAKPGASVGKSVNDAPSMLMDLAARYIGAQQGGRLGNSMGSSLVMAGAFSKKMQGILNGLNRNTARQLLIEAHKDPALYRALLTKPTMSEARQEKAAKVLSAWMIGVGATQEDME